MNILFLLQTTGLSQYPSYHTIYDNLRYYNRFVDPDYRYHTVVTKMLLETTLGIADDFIIPFNITRYVLICSLKVLAPKIRNSLPDRGLLLCKPCHLNEYENHFHIEVLDVWY